jgi:hypothetical protein
VQTLPKSLHPARLRQRFGERIEQVQAMAPAAPQTVDPAAREMTDALVELRRSEQLSERA